MSRVSNPCFNCEERCAECHSNCKRYNQFVRESNKEKQMISSARNKYNDINSFRRQQVEKSLRRRGL